MTYKSYHDATTRSSVLQAVKDTADQAAWARFFDLYAGFVFAVARGKGLSAEDADDVVQGVFIDLARTMPTFDYDRTKGKFRSYLLGLVNWRFLDKVKSRTREADFRATYCEEAKAAFDDKMRAAAASGVPDADEAATERHWQSAAFDEALRRLQHDVRPDHFAAFVESTVEGLDTETVMRLHGLSRDNLYQIRTRFTARLKPLVAAVLKEMDEGRMPRAGGDDPLQ